MLDIEPSLEPLDLLLFFMLWIVGSIVVDQYPCWIGMPNCD